MALIYLRAKLKSVIRSAQAYGLIRRRGSLLLWQHAVPPGQATLSDLSLMPMQTLGGKRSATGPLGESYPNQQWTIWGYVSGKVSRVFLSEFGLVQTGDLQITLPVPFVADPANNVAINSDNDLSAYNSGAFFQVPRDGMPATDVFIFNGVRYTSKAAAVPLLDGNTTFAWRVLVAKSEA